MARDGEPVALEPKAAAVLAMLLAQPGRLVAKADLLRYVWADAHVGENSLARAVAQLRRVLDDDPRRPRFVETVHSRGYRFVAPVTIEPRATPPTAVESPHPETFEQPAVVTSTTTTATGPADDVSRSSPAWWQRRAVAAGLVAALFLIAVMWFMAQRDETRGDIAQPAVGATRPAEAVVLDPKRIAVLPLVELSAGDEHLAYGITEQLIAGLARVAGLRVVPRTTVMTFERGQHRAGEIGRMLAAGSLLEGSVRRDQDRLLITVQLVDAGRDEILWSKDFDRPGDALFDTQAEIVLRVAESLRVAADQSHLALSPSVSTASFTALDHYLRGREGYRQQTRMGNETALAQYAQALDLDPTFAQAWAGQANAFAMRTIRYGDEAAWIARAEASAQRALALAPDLAEGHKALGLVADSRFHLHDALAAYRRAIELAPDYEEALYNAATVAFELGQWVEAIGWQLRDVRRPNGRGSLAIYLFELGLDAEAEAIAGGVLQRDPLTGYLNRYLAARAVQRGDLDDAEQRLDGLQRAYPHWSRVWMTTGDLAVRRGAPEQAARHFVRAAEGLEDADPEIDLRLAQVLPAEQAMRFARTTAMLDDFEAAGSEWHQHAYLRAATLALRGDLDEAVAHYQTAFARGRRSVAWDLDDPALRGFHEDPRFKEVAEAMRVDLEQQRALVRQRHGDTLRALAGDPRP